MSAQIFEDSLELSIGLLETEPVRPGPAYPFPSLRATPQRAPRTFRTLVLENPFLRVTVVPALGGRILRVRDKRTGRDILPASDSLVPESGGRRGAELVAGIHLRLDGYDRLNALGSVRAWPEEPMDEAAPAALWLAESSTANGLGYHLRIALPPDRAEITLEARIHNRTFHPLPYDGEVVVPVGKAELNRAVAYDPESETGVGLFADAPFDGVRIEGGMLRFARFGVNRLLSPRQVDSWTVRLVPVSGLGRLIAASDEAAIGVGEGSVRVLSVVRRPGHKLVLAPTEGPPVEARVDLYPETLTELSLADLPPIEGAALLDASGREVARSNVATAPPPAPPLPAEIAAWPSLAQTDADLERASFVTAWRPAALTALSIRALARGEFAFADAGIERALMFNADDPLLWWEKALARRLLEAGHVDEPSDERPELLNAHFLAPLEPSLKAEAFLSQSASPAAPLSPLVAAVAEVPEDLVEVACLLVERGRLDLSARWIGEALRHADLAMLHLLLAYGLLGARMDAEAADRLAQAFRAAGPPYPWRDIEAQVLEALHSRFPEDRHVAELRKLVIALMSGRAAS